MWNRKRNIFVVLLLIVFVAVGVYIYIDHTLVQTVYSSGDWNPYESPEDLESQSDLVDRIIPTGEKNHVMQYDDEGIPLWYWTESKAIVEEVILEKGEQVLQGDTVTIIEPYSIGDNKTIGKLEILPEDYTKLVKDNAYIIYLKKHEDGSGYMPLGKDQGKVNLTTEEGQKFKSFHDEIKKKYKIEK